MVDLGNEGVQADVGLLLVGLEETLDADLVVDCLDGNHVGLIAATVVLLYILFFCQVQKLKRKLSVKRGNKSFEIMSIDKSIKS